MVSHEAHNFQAFAPLKMEKRNTLQLQIFGKIKPWAIFAQLSNRIFT
jgi:hypothetical protein